MKLSMHRLNVIFAIYLLLWPLQLTAEEEPVFTLNSWLSTGQTKWRHDSTGPLSYNGYPSSELDYKNLDSTVLELNIGNTLHNGNRFQLSFGTGSITGGLLVDDDYINANGAIALGASQSGNHRYSRTHSDLNDSYLFYFDGKVYLREFDVEEERYKSQFYLAGHYWYEEYVATSLTQIECTVLSECYPAGTVIYSNANIITNAVQWAGVGLGAEVDLKLFDTLKYYLDFTFYPIMSLYNEDTHHLRGDLAQNPSISMQGIGTGIDLMTGVKYSLSERASIHLSYRYWQRTVNNQTITFHYPGGYSSSFNLIRFRTSRDGLMAGLTFEF